MARPPLSPIDDKKEETGVSDKGRAASARAGKEAPGDASLVG